MKKLKSFISKIFFPDKETSKVEFFETLPFFLFAILILGWLYFQVLEASPLLRSTPRGIVFTILYGIHLILYWMIFHFIESNRRKISYVIIQGVLAFLIVMLGGGTTTIIALYCALIGNIVGIMGRSKLTIVGVVFYLILLFLNVGFLNAYSEMQHWLPIFIPAMIFAGFFAYFLHIQMARREKDQQMLQELEKTHRELAVYASKIETLTLSNERQRMARELHDTLAQGLAGLILQLEAAVFHVDNGNTVKTSEILQQAMGRARITLVEARSVIDDLRADKSASQSLQERTHQEVERFIQATGISCALNMEVPEEIDETLVEHISRIVAEGLVNIARHAQASQVDIQLKVDGDSLTIQIQDDGVGFDPQKSIRSGHYGLLGMRERLRLAGGSLKIDSENGKGTILKLIIPIPAKVGEIVHE
ncbi:MAG: sensor histidine kinase [Anaerolineaceae bacterium]|nr:sensor histidine kinase [Anaerolineaceae bacterium]